MNHGKKVRANVHEAINFISSKNEDFSIHITEVLLIYIFKTIGFSKKLVFKINSLKTLRYILKKATHD